MSYHHGDLRAGTLALVDRIVRRHGPEAVTLRALGAELGVSHGSFRHHFGTRAGVLSAFAAQGYGWLAERLEAAGAGGYLETGVAYVRFATDHPAHFQVMFATDLLDPNDPALITERTRCLTTLVRSAQEVSDHARPDMAAAVLAGWSLMHGLATLHDTGVLDQTHLADLVGESDVLELARRVGAMLFGSPSGGD